MSKKSKILLDSQFVFKQDKLRIDNLIILFFNLINNWYYN